jgi:hypothetical protein
VSAPVWARREFSRRFEVTSYFKRALIFIAKSLAFSVIFLLVGALLVRLGGREREVSAKAQAATYEKQLEASEKMQRRAERLLEVQEEQARRFNAVLDVWERQAGVHK